jgi:membrane protein implicated in regulation of membrane protease activity
VLEKRELGMIETTEIILVIIGLGVTAALVSLYFWWVGGAIFEKPMTGAEGLLGREAVATTDISPDSPGEVSVDGVLWKASLSPNDYAQGVLKGEKVVIVKVSSLTLEVRGKRRE